MKYIGIDGCKGGWATVIFQEDEVHYEVFPQITALMTRHSDAGCILIDMPIGLSEAGVSRTIDQELRALLKPVRHHSVFTPPCRNAVYASDYDSARAINRKEEGKSISIQAWNISNKIKELDQWLIQHPKRLGGIREAHPELCFLKLNQDIHLNFRKREKELKGVKERIQILERFWPAADDFFQQFRAAYPSSLIASDDITDAMVLGLHAKLGSKNGWNKVIEEDLSDSRGLPIQLLYYQPE